MTRAGDRDTRSPVARLTRSLDHEGATVRVADCRELGAPVAGREVLHDVDPIGKLLRSSTTEVDLRCQGLLGRHDFDEHPRSPSAGSNRPASSSLSPSLKPSEDQNSAARSQSWVCI